MAVHDVTDLTIDYVSLTKAGVDPDAHVTLAKARVASEDKMATLPDALRKALGDETADMLTDEQAEAVSTAFEDAAKPAEDETADPDATTTPAAAPAATVVVENVTVAEPTEVGKSVEAIQKSLDETREALAAEVTGREEREFVAENLSRFKHVGDGAEAVAKSLFAVHKGTGTDEDHERIDKALAGASEQIATSPAVGAERGTGTGGDTGPSAEIGALAKAKQEANPDMSDSDATAAALRTPEGKQAYENYEIERQARVHAAGGTTAE